MSSAGGPPLRVGINLLFLGERGGGAGRYASELPAALLAADPSIALHLFVSHRLPASLRRAPWAAQARWITVPSTARVPQTQAASEYLLLPALAAALRLDLLHSPANTGPVRVPGVAGVVSLLDLIWLHRPAEWEADPRVHRIMRRRVQRVAAQADRLLAISEAAAQDIAETLGVARERIEVTPLGARASQAAAADEATLRRQLDLGQSRVLLCVAQKRPYKNLHRLIRALPDLEQDVVLVLVGAHTPHEQELRDLAAQLGVLDRVRFPDWLSEEQLEGLYAMASAFALPSLIEGFGLPVIEAMLRGVPVACSGTTALGEVAGEAALRFDPESQEQIVESLRRLLGDPALAAELSARGREQAARFTWERTGAATLAGYRNALAARRSG